MAATTDRTYTTHRRSWWPFLALCLLAVAGVGTWAYFRTRPEAGTAERRDIVVRVGLNGEAIAPPSERAEVFSYYQAPISRVYATVGKRVSPGEILAELSYPSAEVYLEQARQSLKLTEMNYANARRQFGSALRAAQTQLAQAQANERSARRAASMARARTFSDFQREEFTEAPPVDLEGAVQARMDAERQLMQAETDLETSLLPFQRQMEAARAEFQAAQAGKKSAMIRSPIKGTVLALNVQPGEVVGQSDDKPVATIVDLDAMRIHAQMKPDQVGWVKVDQPVILTFEDMPNKQFEGTVRRITTEVASKVGGLMKEHVTIAVIRFKNEDGLIKPGMDATLTIEVAEAEDAIAVPADAVDRDKSGRPIVKVLRDGRWHPVVVEVGLSDGRYTEILSGLKEGDTVQVTPGIL